MPKTKIEPIWWLSLLRRMVRWGIVMGLIVDCLPLLVVAWLIYRGYFRSMVLAPETELWDAIVLTLLGAGVFTCPLVLLGAIIGWAGGFFAPPGEPTNPLKSKFLRIVAMQTLSVWAVMCLFVGTGLKVIHLLFFNRPPYYYRLSLAIICGVIGIALFLFMFSLWRAINCARKAQQR